MLGINKSKKKSTSIRLAPTDGQASRRYVEDVASQEIGDGNGQGSGACGTSQDNDERKSLEQALQLSESLQRSLIDNAPIGMALSSLDTRFVRANCAFCLILGYTETELRKMTFKDITHPEDLERSVSGIADLRAGKIRQFVQDKRYFKKDTQVIHGRVSVGAVRGDNGDVTHFVVQLEDITERKGMEAKILEASAQQAAILAAVPDIIMQVDNNKVYTWANQAGLDFFGDDVVGAEAACYFVGEQDTYAAASSVFEGTDRTLYLESWQRRQDGEDRLLAWWCRSLKDGSGNVIGALSAAQDITERREAERCLRESEQKYRDLVDNAPAGIVVTSLDGRVIEVNQALAHMHGYESKQEFVESHVSDRFHDIEDRHRWVRLVQAKGRVEGYEIETKRKDGSLFWTSLTSIPHATETGERQLVTVSVNITDRKIAEEALRNSERMYRSLFDNMLEGLAHCKIVLEEDVPVDFVYLSVNKSFEVLTGLKDVVGKRVSEVIPGIRESEPELIATYGRVASNGTPDRFETYVKALNNWFAVSVFSPVKGEFVAVFDVITERKRDEEALRSSEQRYRQLAEGVSDLFFAMDKELRYTYWNKACEELTGIPSENAIGRRLTDIYPDTESTRTVTAAYSEAMKSKKPIHLTLEYPGYGKAIHEIAVYPTEDGVSVFVKDVTERKKVEEALLLKNYAFDSAISADLIADVDGIVTDCNKAFCEAWGYGDKTEVIGKLAASFMENEIEAQVILDALKAEGRWSGHSLAKRKNGSTFVANNMVTYILDSAGRLVGSQSSAMNVTSLVEAEEQLRAERENFRACLEVSPVGIQIITKQAETVYVNPALLGMWGYSELEEFRRIPAEEKYAAETLEWVLQIRRRVHNGERVGEYEHEYTIVRKDGQLRRLMAHRREIIWNGEMCGQVLFEDVTERRLAEEALQTERHNFRNSVDDSPLAIQIASLDGDLVYANVAMLEFWGLSTIDELRLIPLESRYTIESANQIRANVLRYRHGIIEGRNELTALQHGRPRLLLANRKRVTWDGQPAVQIVHQDITESKEMEESLARAAEEWRTTFDSISDFVTIHDKDNRLLRVNRTLSDSLKTEPREIVGKFCHEIMHGTSEPPADCPRRKTLATGKPATCEMYLPNLHLWLQESTSPIFGGDGKVTGTVNIAKDVTERKQLQDQLLLSDRLASIGELVSGVAHEMNNPMTSIMGFSELLMEKELSADIKEDLAFINSEAQRAAGIIKNLLTFARKHPPLKQPAQINAIVDDVLRLRAHEQRANSITVVRQLAPDLPEVMADYHQMQQVFLNIVANAEFSMIQSHRMGTLTVATKVVEGFVRTSITDDGPGIPEQNLVRIFDPFFTTKEVGKGTGLGLSISHGIVSEHGGRIYAESDHASGATFVVELPITQSSLGSIAGSTAGE